MATVSPIQQEQDQDQPSREQKAVKRWLARIKREKRLHEDYRDAAIEAYSNFKDQDWGDDLYYPLQWSVVQVQQAATYSSVPVPDVRPRNSDRNPLFKQAAQVMQRSLEFYIDQTDFDADMKRVTQDYLVAALAVPRVKLDAEIIETEVTDPTTGELMIDDETGEPMMEPVITEQMVRVEHHPWRWFGWEPVSNWAHCDWVYYEHHLTMGEIKRRWGDDVNPPPSSGVEPGDQRKAPKKERIPQKLHVVYEIWDRRNKEVLVISKGNDEPLEINSDPLGLSGFFPSPPPPMLNVDDEELIPWPDYCYYQDLDNEIQRLSKRARLLTEQIKAASLHEGSLSEMEDLTSLTDGTSIAVRDLEARYGENADLRKLILFFPIQERVVALAEVTKQLQLKRQQVDDLLGISDVVRGSSNPQDGQETNKIKERWAGIRLRPKQIAIQHMIRNLFRMMAELTVEHMTPENLAAMTQVEITPELMALLQNDMMREFAIDVESDSTIAKDEMADRQARTELLSAINSYVQVVAPAVQQNLIPADLGREVLQLATDPYKKFSRGLDDVIEGMETTQAQLQRSNQAQQQAQGQIAQLTEEKQKLEYALNQFSEAEDARQNLKTESEATYKGAQTQEVLSKIPDNQVQPDKTLAETDLTHAQVGKTQAEETDILRPDPAPTPTGG